ncbi:putative glycolipid-binding domain-containing protein [Pontibacillus sp. ALD_SL1]|uniref:putative glycolipid-binding domain-containing protein n=1 Tax=Pontibacillus sp. ALD_SL1 TaxID=2777185 RepID=UPI001A95C64B|nr:putative glycolipid-binding domain-containing protein [Pontibacillus sp. ALD_SL1]QST00913.1 putative glycolipid-binding domain-containing protein [Pontibacillus sp. ALD_SL1]
METKILWEHIEQSGSEYLKISVDEKNVTAQGVVLFATKKDIHHITYSIIMDQNWLTRRVDIKEEGTQRVLSLYSDGKGNWRAGDEPLLEMQGAIDVDLSMTPFSNTLPINRFNWDEGQERELDMVYVEVPGFKLVKVKQHYTFLGNEGDLRKF